MRKCFLILSEEKNIFFKEFERFYFLFLWPTCKLGKKESVWTGFTKGVKLFLFLNKKCVFRKWTHEFYVPAWLLIIFVFVCSDCISLQRVHNKRNTVKTAHRHPQLRHFYTKTSFHSSSISQLVGVMYTNPLDSIINGNPTKPVIQDLRFSSQCRRLHSTTVIAASFPLMWK